VYALIYCTPPPLGLAEEEENDDDRDDRNPNSPKKPKGKKYLFCSERKIFIFGLLEKQ